MFPGHFMMTLSQDRFPCRFLESCQNFEISDPKIFPIPFIKCEHLAKTFKNRISANTRRIPIIFGALKREFFSPSEKKYGSGMLSVANKPVIDSTTCIQ